MHDLIYVMSDLPSNLCIKPWLHLVVRPDGTYSPCCKHIEPIMTGDRPARSMNEAWNSQEMQDLRKSFLANERPSACSACWRHEATGAVSDRMDKIEHITKAKGKEFVLSSIQSPKPSPVFLDIKFSNLCNLKCRICDPEYSVRIAQEQKAMGLLNKINLPDNERFLPGSEDYKSFLEWLPGIDFLEIYGGEPLLAPQHEPLLDACIDSGHASRIGIRYNTNGTISPLKFAEKWNKFKSVSLWLSIDDIGKRYEYQRSGANWKKVEENLLHFQQIANGKTVWGFSSTISAFNVLHLRGPLELARKFNVPIYLGMLQAPWQFHVSVLPDDAKEKVRIELDRLEQENFPIHPHTPLSTFRNALDANPDDLRVLRDLFRNEVQRVDQFRGENLSQTLPELSPLMVSV